MQIQTKRYFEYTTLINDLVINQLSASRFSSPINESDSSIETNSPIICEYFWISKTPSNLRSLTIESG